ncbi:glycoside hydrolase family 97 protein [Phocaeicola fibrisolvens]|uniref:glycoside hydrolase family 97 protein n=1 Tax=Phocaeicola fibrisolvens TaxID=2981793 RepID=UPI000822A25E|nr:glycoside hydrolase family 97 protein [Phocaeicola fibrisolvens]MCU6778691.1 glycoside hydrolase family 97 protein [Phocaeicola fibrisolvens]SCI02429.1 Retaining alpha-galactosidase precursor [uncultured Bacteroides sp.]
MRKTLFFLLLASSAAMFAENYTVKSPDERILVNVETGATTTYSVTFNGKTILNPSPLSMTFDNGVVIGRNMKVKDVQHRTEDQMLTPVVRQKSDKIRDHYNEMVLNADQYKLYFRVYNDGLAYRFHTDFADSLKVISEEVDYCFPEDYNTLFPEERTILSAQQPLFKPMKLSEIGTDRFCSTPVLIKVDDQARIFISESDLESYPGMFLKKQGKYELAGKFAAYSLEEEKTDDRQIFPTKRADYIARVSGTRNYPWRAMIVAENDANLVTNQLIYKLAPESQGDFSWVKPGKIAWDWYNALILTGVDFKCGINNETYKYYIDFASKYGLEYVVLDDGWSEAWDVTKTVPEIDMEELVAYGKKKNVGLILWVSWAPFREKLDEAFALFSKWGIKGIKMDFMNRDDQAMVDFYYTVARKAAAHRMLVDFHGAYKPTGWLRTFPNVLSSEGVAGLENHKWGSFVTPEHNVTLPFTRMVAGPMDYTPGAMINFHEKDHKVWFNLPASIGTRCHQLGMYVVYESPLQMLADSPSNYYREEKCMEFLSQVPVVWDETRVLKASVGEYIVVARRSGDTWFIGGMVGKKGQKFDITLDFIKGNKTLTCWEDGVNVDLQAQDFACRTKKVKQGDTITISMYDGGGYVAIIK